MKWSKHRHDPVGLGAKSYTDWHSECGDFVCAQGLDEYEREHGKPWALLYKVGGVGPRSERLIKVGCFTELKDAQLAAVDL